MGDRAAEGGAGPLRPIARWAARNAMPAFFTCLVALTCYLQGRKLTADLGLQAAIQSVMLVGVPLTAYHYYREVSRSGRPILAGLMHAVALFSAIMALAIADMGDPISRALESETATRLPFTEPEEQASADSPNSTVPAAAASALRTRAPAPAATPGSAPGKPRQPATSGSPTSTPTSATYRTGSALRDRASAGYSLYDMLSLIGMIATITLIVFGALVPEESRMLERRRERRRRALDSFGRFSTAVTDFHQSQLSHGAGEAQALTTWHAGNELEMLVDDPGVAEEVAAAISRLHVLTGVGDAISRTRPTRERRPTPADLQAELRSLRTLLERSHPRQP